MEQNKTRTVSLPLKLKLILLFSVLLASSLSFYVYFATNLFNQDKTAYIFESGLSHVESLSQRVDSIIHNSAATLRLLGQFAANPNQLDSNFKKQGNLVSFQAFQNQDGFYQELQAVYSQNELLFYKSKVSDIKALQKQFPIDFELIKSREVYLKSFFDYAIPHLLLGVSDGDKVYIGRILVTEIGQAFSSSKIYHSYLLSSSGELLFSGQDKLTKKEVTKESFLLKILAQDMVSGVKEITRQEQEYLLAFKKNERFGVNVFAEISKEKAFYAAKYLERKSVWFGVFLLSIVIMIAILFSRRLTQNIEKLFEATREISEGKFETQVVIKSHDEIGVLSDSFNFMAKKIVHYIEQMKEKARIENEIAVAKLVQDSFFPANDISGQKLEIAAFYTPASECGGDWWGHITHGNKSIIGIIDATGHGVPAALLTATANCCFENLKTIVKQDASYLSEPAKILQFMNQAVCGVGSEILMTAFIAIIDHNTNTLTYSNASHNPPFHFVAGPGEVSKENFKPLMEANSNRLGHEQEATFGQAIVEIAPNDAIIFFTDGITEGLNNEDKQWGPRRFIKSLMANINLSAKEAKDNIMKEAFEFYDNRKNDDDITLVIAKVK